MKARLKIILIVVGILAVLILIIWAANLHAKGIPWADWTGFGDYTNPKGEFSRGKTLWDLLELLIIPVALALIALWFNRQERRDDRTAADERAKVDREIANDRLQEQALQSYLDKMTDLLLKEDLRGSKKDDELRIIARSRTLTTLRTLDNKRKGLLLKFLFETNLITCGNEIINLAEADLSGAELSGADLSEVNLRETNLSRANLSWVTFIKAELIGVNLRETDMCNVDLGLANLFNSDLSGADLSGANLNEANLSSTKLIEANLNGVFLNNADLSRADLRGANMENAILDGANLTMAVLNQAGLKEPILNSMDERIFAKLIGENLENINGTILTGATYNKETKWPEGFDPQKAGAKLYTGNG